MTYDITSMYIGHRFMIFLKEQGKTCWSFEALQNKLVSVLEAEKATALKHQGAISDARKVQTRFGRFVRMQPTKTTTEEKKVTDTVMRGTVIKKKEDTSYYMVRCCFKKGYNKWRLSTGGELNKQTRMIAVLVEKVNGLHDTYQLPSGQRRYFGIDGSQIESVL